MRTFYAILFLLLVVSPLKAQEISFNKKKFEVVKAGTVNLSETKDDFMPSLQNLEMPKPGSNSERAKLMEIKKESRKRFPVKENIKPGKRTASPAAQQPIIGKNFVGNPYNFRVPNDNNICISNDGKLLTAINSTLFGWDVIGDTALFFPTVKSLGIIAQPLGLPGSKFDPKLVYDPNADKFILVFLSGFTPTTSYVMMAFSESSDPTGNWNLYALSGDPLNDTTWSDYPAIALTENELFITVNQLWPDSTWQTGFKQSIIWQIDKSGGYAGDTLLPVQLWSGVKFGGKSIRNLNPVKGGNKPHGPNMYCLSNRNFDIQNDSIFIVEVTDTLNAPGATLNIQMRKSNANYGVPPFARQANGHEFDTNDGRILGAFLEEDKIQFVSNAIDTTTGFAAVYHGIISDVSGIPVVTGSVIGDTAMDLGYPNIAWTGKKECDTESIIVFDHTAPNVFSGHSAIYYSNNGEYSDITGIKQGDNYVNIIAGTYERWGDYSGIQRKFNEPGKVWIAASWGDVALKNRTWISEITSPDSITGFPISDNITATHCDNCDGQISVTPIGGTGPYTYLWDTNAGNQTTSSITGLCAGTYVVTITDQNSCTIHVAEVNTDTLQLLVLDSIQSTYYNSCDAKLNIVVSGGTPPYSYLWNDPNQQTSNEATGLCAGTYSVIVIDALGCTQKNSGMVYEPDPETTLFPNPVDDIMTLNFTLDNPKEINVSVYDARGRIVTLLLEETAKEGRNLFSFSTYPLSKGIYTVRITSNEEVILKEKFMKY